MSRTVGRAPRTPSAWRRPGRRQPVVLLYHGFSDVPRDDDPENLFVRLGCFDTQLRWLHEQGWTPLSWSDYDDIQRRGARAPRRSFLVTIDDAYVSTRAGVEVLTRHGVPCVVYTPAGLAGQTAEWLPEPEDEPLLSMAELRDLNGPLVDFGVHGWDHTPMVDRDDDELRHQTVGARERLAEAGIELRPTFAYPFGDHDADARRAVEAAGFVSAFSVFDDVGAYAISRVDVNATDSLRSFRLKLMPGYRALWRTLERAAILRRATRAVLTSSANHG